MMHGLLWQVPLVRLDPWDDDRVGESYCCTETLWLADTVVGASEVVTHCPTAKCDHSPR